MSAGRRAEEPVVAHFVKTARKNVLEKAAQKLGRCQSSGPPALSLSVFVAKGYRAVLSGQEARVGDGDPVNVARQVVDHLGNALDSGFAVDDPRGLPERLGESLGGEGLAGEGHEARPEEH